MGMISDYSYSLRINKIPNRALTFELNVIALITKETQGRPFGSTAKSKRGDDKTKTCVCGN